MPAVRTPPQSYQPYTKPLNESGKVNPNILTVEDNNRKLNQSAQSANRDTELVNTNNTRPAYRGQRRLAAQEDNDDSDKQRQPQDNAGDEEREATYTGCRRGINLVGAKVETVNTKIEALDSDWRDVPHKVGEVETKMAYNGHQVDDLAWRNKVHSAKIHELERELKYVKLENDQIKGRMGKDGLQMYERDVAEFGHGYTDRNNYGHDQHPGQAYPGPDPGYGGEHADPNRAQLQAQQGKPMAKNEQHRVAHRQGEGPDGEEYWGFNKFYNPQYLTAYRREHVPYYTNKEEKEKQTQYADDFNYLQEMQRRQEEEWRYRRQMEEAKWLKDKPRTFDYTAPYQANAPPRDVNKYFHDSKHLQERPEPKPDEYYFHQQQPGGLYFIRFNDSGFDEVNVSLKEQQTIVKSFGGYVLGVARKHNIIVIEGDAEWRFPKNPLPPRHQVAVPHRITEDAIALLWFPSKDKAFDFFSNSFRNRFKQQGFPTPQSWEGHYVPLQTPPFLMGLDTYLVLELHNAGKYQPENIQQFEADARQAILAHTPNSLPFVASALKGREGFKPGPLFKDKSQVFISRFSSIGEMSAVWKDGVMQRALQKWNLSGPISVYAVSLRDWVD